MNFIKMSRAGLGHISPQNEKLNNKKQTDNKIEPIFKTITIFVALSHHKMKNHRFLSHLRAFLPL